MTIDPLHYGADASSLAVAVSASPYASTLLPTFHVTAPLSLLDPAPPAPRKRRYRLPHAPRDVMRAGTFWVCQKAGYEDRAAVMAAGPIDGDRVHLVHLGTGRNTRPLITTAAADWRPATDAEAAALRATYPGAIAEALPAIQVIDDAGAAARDQLTGQVAARALLDKVSNRLLAAHRDATVAALDRICVDAPDEHMIAETAQAIFYPEDVAALSDDLVDQLDLVRPVHPSHKFPTADGLAAMPEADAVFAEGCGGCAALSGDYEAKAPCDPPKPMGDAMLCEHASECPAVCPCDVGCYCKSHACCKPVTWRRTDDAPPQEWTINAHMGSPDVPKIRFWDVAADRYIDGLVLGFTDDDRAMLDRLLARERAAVAHLGPAVAAAIDDASALLGLLRRADADAAKAAAPTTPGQLPLFKK